VFGFKVDKRTGEPAPCNYRDRQGNPTRHDPGKEEEARTQSNLAENTVISVIDWVADGAIKGEQRCGSATDCRD
jgi:hypothetical protein